MADYNFKERHLCCAFFLKERISKGGRSKRKCRKCDEYDLTTVHIDRSRREGGDSAHEAL